MKKYIKTGWMIGALLLTLGACDSRLDIQPTQSIEESSALLTEQDVRITLIGAYDGMAENEVYGGAVQYTGELLGDDRDVVFGGTFTTLDEIWRKTITPTNLVVRDLWLFSYNAINRANNVLSAIDKVGADSRNDIEGQARFIRGSLYFELVRLFGKQWGDGNNAQNPGVPLVLTPTREVSDADSKPRNSVAEVYAQVIDDLTKAEQLISADGSNAAFATKNAAAAMLARVYLQQGNYAAARDAANRVIQSGKYSLTAAFGDAFADATNGSEVIFRIFVTEQDGINDMNTYFASARNQGRGDIRVQQKFRQLYAAGDTRGTFLNTAGQNTFTSKFNDQFGDIPVIRLAEMYLIRAEANLRLNTSVGATPLADVNRIRARAGAAPLTAVTLDDILRERRLELAFEGFLIHDIRRTGGRVGNTAANANNLVLPVPQREVDTNKQLTQNPGY